MSENTLHPKYRPDIDGLRAIAVLSVVIYHAFPSSLRGGFLGVDIFFVISGFLISTILFKNIDQGSFSIGDFYSRRIRRIFPALALVLISVLAFGWFSLFPDELQQLGKHTASSAGFIQNFTLWKEAGYFDNSSETKPLLHVWSLGIEEQFYFVWPLLLWGSGYLGKVCWAGRHRRLCYFLPIVSVFLISFFLNLKSISVDSTKTFYLPQYRFFELALGGLLSWWVLYQPKISLTFADEKESFWPDRLTEKRLKNILSFVGLLILLIIFGRFRKETVFPGKNALLPIFATAFIIWAGPYSWLNRKILSHKILVWFGLISYPLYLWHWPILSFGRIIYGEMPTREFRFIAVAVSILLAWLTVKIFEKPFRYGNARIPLKLVTLCLLVFGTGLVGKFVQKSNWLKEHSFGYARVKGIEYTDENLPGEIKCDPKELINENINYCFKSSHNTGKSNAVIIGDSHAVDKFHGIAKNDLTRNWLVLANSSCPPVLGIEIIGPDKRDCPPKVEKIIDFVAKDTSLQTIILSFAGMYFQTEPVAINHRGSEIAKISKNGIYMISLTDRKNAFAFGLENAVEKLQNKKNVYIFFDIPELPFYPRDCFRKLKNCSITRESAENRQKDLWEILQSIQNKFPNVTIFNPFDFICGKNSCSYKNGNTIYYRDGHHLSLEGSSAYAEQFLKVINSK